MANTVFISKIWAARLLANLDKNLVYAGLCNRDYEGEISNKGDTVHIQALSAITIGDYGTGDMTSQDLDGSNLDLVIDQAKYFNFKVEDVLKLQANPTLMDAAMKDAATALADVADQHVAAHYADAGSTIGTDVSPIVITAANAYDNLVDLGTALTEKNVPTTGRWAVIPPWFSGMMKKDTRLVAAGDQQAAAARISGYLGHIAGFDLYESNNVPNTAGAKYKIMAGSNMAISYAQQILKTETIRAEKRFADIVRGLMVYGTKTVRPNALAVLVANKTA